MNPEIIYKNKDFLVINKQAGLLVHSTGKGEESLVDWLVKNYPDIRQVGDNPKERPGIVHRLDKDTSGVLLICLNQKTFDYFKGQFQEHKIKKIYLALVRGVPKKKEGIIDKPIGLKSGTTKRTVHTKKAKMVKEAITKYKVTRVIPNEVEGSHQQYALLQIEPLTGRTHQIRVHLASINHPIVGDKLYGRQRGVTDKIKRQFLHAESLEFTTPSGERLKISAELPKDLKEVIDSIQ